MKKKTFKFLKQKKKKKKKKKKERKKKMFGAKILLCVIRKNYSICFDAFKRLKEIKLHYTIPMHFNLKNKINIPFFFSCKSAERTSTLS